MKFSSPTKFKWAAGCLCIWTVVLINVAIFIGMIIDSVVDKKIQDTVIMTKSNMDQWGDVPGKYDIHVKRNLTLFHIINPEDIFTDKPVKVKHTEPIIIREKHLTENSVFTNDDDLVSFNQTYTYDVDMDQSKYDQICNQNVTIANIYALGAWDTAAKRLNMSQKAFYILGTLLTSMVSDEDIYYESVSLGLMYLYIDLNTFDQLYTKDFQPAGISMEKAQWIYSDSLHGWSNNVTIKRWVQAFDQGAESDLTMYIADYYNLDYDQISRLATGRIGKAVKEVSMLIKSNYDCPSVGTRDCDSNFLAAIQLGRQDVTLHPPPPVISFPSLRQKNSSVFGMPEFSYFYDDYFTKDIEQNPDYKNHTLTVQQSVLLFNFDAAGYVLDLETTLAHPMNMDKLIRSGMNFDNTKNLEEFKKIDAQLRVNNLYLTRGLYEWSKYLATNFSSGGLNNMQLATKTKWSQIVLSDNMAALLANLKPFLQAEFALAYLTQNKKDCPTMVKNTLLNPSATVIINFCQSGWTKDAIKGLYGYCDKPTTSYYQKNKEKLFGFTYLQMNLLCDIDDDVENSIGDALREIDLAMGKQYNCNNSYCSHLELALQQLTNSSITLNPPVGSNLQVANSISAWLPDLFPSSFELKYFLEKTGQTIDPISFADAKDTWDWSNLLSPMFQSKALADSYNGNDTLIKTRAHFSSSKVLESYINFLTLEIYLGGATYTGRVCDIIYGFAPEVVTKMRLIPPLMGGDPSTPEYVSMNPNNSWVQQTRYTGKKDLNKVGNFYSAFGNRNIAMMKQFWDGKNVYNSTINPWTEEIPIVGGDAQFIPHANTNVMQAGYITDLYKQANSQFVEKTTKNLGIETYRYKGADSDFEISAENNKYYMFKYNNMINLTSVKQAPVFISKMGFHKTNDSIKNNVQFFDNKDAPFAWQEEMDGFLYLEPKTGAPFDISVNFQINLDLSKDDLFATKQDFLLPVFLLRRRMELSDDQVNI